MISLVSPEKLDNVWPALLPMVNRGLRHGAGDTLTPCGILKSLKSGDMALWVAHDETELFGGMVYMIAESPRKKSIRVVMLAGVNFDDWADELSHVLFNFRDAIGADCVEAVCRKGMAKKLRDRGWKQKAVVMEA